MTLRLFVDKFALNPFKYYRRAAGTTFCLVAATNFGTGLFDNHQREVFNAFPEAFFVGTLLKGVKYSLIFPAFYIQALVNPKKAFYLSGILDEEVRKQSGDGKIVKRSYKIYGKGVPERYHYESVTTVEDGQVNTTVTFNGRTTTRKETADGEVIISNMVNRTATTKKETADDAIIVFKMANKTNS